MSRRRPGRLHWPTQERPRRRLRRLIWSVALVLVGLVVGLAAGQPFASRPVGQANVLVNPLPGNAFSVRSPNTLVDLKTEAQLVFSDDVLSKVRSLSGGHLDPAGLRRRVSAGVVNNAEVITISYRGDTSVDAAEMARQVAERFLEVRSKNAADAAVARSAVVTSALDQTQHDFHTASQAGKDPAVLAVLAQRINSLRGNLRAVGATPPSAGSVLAASAPHSAKVRMVRVGLLVTSVLVAGLIGLRIGGRPRHLPRWTRRVRLRRRISVHGRTQAQAR